MWVGTDEELFVEKPGHPRKEIGGTCSACLSPNREMGAFATAANSRVMICKLNDQQLSEVRDVQGVSLLGWTPESSQVVFGVRGGPLRMRVVAYDIATESLHVLGDIELMLYSAALGWSR